MRLLLKETMVIWLLGGILGSILAVGGVSLLARLLADEIPPVFQIALGLRVVGVVLAVRSVGKILERREANRSGDPDIFVTTLCQQRSVSYV